MADIDIVKLKNKAKLKGRYAKQLKRLKDAAIDTDCIETAVNGAVSKLSGAGNSSMVIYGEPQSGKTEMMVCLTAKLLDQGNSIIVHLLNDSVDLLSQNLKRFRGSALPPSAKTSSELQAVGLSPLEVVVLCKKNPRDLQNLITWLKNKKSVVVIDDEADYATPNSEVNQGTKTKINSWVQKVIGAKGTYIGVTATPARLDLNNTFGNDTNRWVKFPPHTLYTGQDTFFPLDVKTIQYRLVRLQQGGSPSEAQEAVLRFLVSVAYLNTTQTPANYTMLVHTSGKRDDHESDRAAIEKTASILLDGENAQFNKLVTKIHSTATKLYPEADAQHLAEYIVENASRTTMVVLNSRRDRKAAGDNATDPTSPFSIVVGGNIVSRGVTFPNLLSMFFTRDVKSKLQQDTYIQRARMFGARGAYLKHFELTIPTQLFDDWHRCFVYHRLSLSTIENNLGVPVWLADRRISVAATASIDKSTVTFDKGEMSFGMFDYATSLDSVVSKAPTSVETLVALHAFVGNVALPQFLIDYIRASLKAQPLSLAIHTASSVEGYKDGPGTSKKNIFRKKGFIGNPQLEPAKYPKAEHHVKIFYNKDGKARIFYKYGGGLQFLQNLKNFPA